jgi:invasion protein IalB
MRQALKIALSALALVAAGPVTAQTEPAAPAPADGGQAAPLPGGNLAIGEPVTGEAGIGEPYIGEEFRDWLLRCVRTESGNDPCQLYQLLSDQQGNSVAEISVFPLPAGQQAEAGVTIITPLETLLTEQITMRVDEGQPKRYPFTFCAARAAAMSPIVWVMRLAPRSTERRFTPERQQAPPRPPAAPPRASRRARRSRGGTRCRPWRSGWR